MLSYNQRHWDMIFDNLKFYYPTVEEDTVDWYPSGQWSITVRLKNGKKYKYNYMSNEFMRVCDYDEYEIPEEKQWRMNFAVALNNRLKMIGMTQTELARRTGISKGMITNYVLGTSTASGYNIAKIVRALNCTYEELMESGF